MIPEHSLAATRSSARWSEKPGSFDKLNTRVLFASLNEHGIPDLPAAGAEPARLVAYNDRACREPKPGDCLHWFLDDYRFEAAWSLPQRVLSRVQRVGTALTPDFSLWREMPRCMQVWQVYRSRWCGAWWAMHGVSVIPTVSWSGEASYDFAFAGIPPGSAVGVSAVGVMRDREARRLFGAGYEAMLATVRPSLVLAYGKLPPGLPDCPVRVYPTRWER